MTTKSWIGAGAYDPVRYRPDYRRYMDFGNPNYGRAVEGKNKYKGFNKDGTWYWGWESPNAFATGEFEYLGERMLVAVRELGIPSTGWHDFDDIDLPEDDVFWR